MVWDLLKSPRSRVCLRVMYVVVWISCVIFVTVCTVKIQTAADRLEQAMYAMVHAQPPTVTQSELTSMVEGLEPIRRASPYANRPLRRLLYCVLSDDCGGCQATALAWANGIDRLDVGGRPDIVLITPRTINESCALFGRAHVWGVNTSIYRIADLPAYEVRSGISRMPFSVLFTNAGDAACVIAGVPAAGDVRDCLERVSDGIEGRRVALVRRGRLIESLAR